MRVEELPSGLVTFVITDIEGSTRLLKSLGDEYVDRLDLHHRLLREVWDRHSGAEFNTEGDSFVVAFEEATDAVEACAAALQVIDDVDWGDHPFRIRVGAHCGAARPRDGDYVALALHQTARVSGAANGRQAVVTDDVLLRAVVSDEVRITPAGRYRMRDFEEPVALHFVSHRDFRPEPRALRALPAEKHNLPRPPTPLLDRQEEMERLSAMVESGTVTTLWGPGGVGKTRLVTEFGRAAAEEWPDGVWMANLSAARSEAEMIAAVASALGVPLTGADDPSSRLVHALTERRCLLLLDNCEHLLAPVAAFVGAVRNSGAAVALLATSRSPLGLLAERRLQLEPFAPPTSGGPDPAVELFAQRAAEIGCRTGDLDTVRRLCERLDGLPLAVEMAAARVDLMTPAEMLDGFDRRLGPLRLDDPGLPDRHQSMDAAIDWSYELLGHDERTALRRLTVLRSAFDVGTATAVCFDEPEPEEDATEALWSLVSSSVVHRQVHDAETRFRLLRTLRTRMRQLADDEELRAAAQRAAEHFDRRFGPGTPVGFDWVSSVDVDLANLRGLVDVQSGVDDALRLRLLWSIGRLHDVRDEFRLGIEELSAHLDDLPALPESVAVLTLLADLHLRIGDLDGAEGLLERGRALAAEVGPATWDRGGVARTGGEIALRQGRLDDAEAIARAALSDNAALQPAARLWNLVGLVRANAGDMEGAIVAFEDELTRWREIGDEAAVAVVHGNLAEAMLRVGRTRAAAEHQLECLRGAAAAGRPILVGFSMTVAAHLAGQEGHWREACELQGVSDHLLDAAGYALYDADAEARDDLLRTARDLHGDDVDTWLEAGRRLDPTDAAERASVVLERAAAAVPSP